MKYGSRLVERLMVTTLSGITGLEEERFVVRGGPRPGEGPHCALRWKELKYYAHNHGYYTLPDETAQPMTQHLYNKGEGTLVFSFRGKGALDRAEAARGHLDNDNRQFDLWLDPLGCGGIGPILNEFHVLGGAELEFARFEIDLNFSFSADYAVDWFDDSQWRLTDNNSRDEEFTYSEADHSNP